LSNWILYNKRDIRGKKKILGEMQVSLYLYIQQVLAVQFRKIC
jgi:hypothetical protein